MARRPGLRDRLGVIVFALVVVASIIGLSFAAGYLLGKLLL